MEGGVDISDSNKRAQEGFQTYHQINLLLMVPLAI